MANGPLGGFMPTPPSPGQPPQVKLETSAESRGAFNKFLGTLPKNGAVAPIQTGVVQSSTAPVSPMTSNVNIFEPQNFLSGGLVQFGRDLQRGLADPVNQKTKEIPQFLQVIEDSAKERFGVDLSDSSSMGGSGSVPFSNISIPGPGLPGFNPFGSDMNIFQPTQPAAPKDYSITGIRPAYMPMDQDGDGIDQFGAVMPEFEANKGSPMTLSDANSAFERGMSGLKSSAFGTGGSRIAGIGSFANMFQPRAYFDGGFVDDFEQDTSAGDFTVGDPDISVSSDEIAGGTFDDGDSGVSFTDDSAGGVDIVTGGQPTETPGVVDTRPRTNIRNVGAGSNLRFDPQFTANILQQQGLDPRGFMSKDDFAQTTQGGASVAPVNLSTGLKTLANTTQKNQFVDPNEGIAPVSKTVGTGVTTTPNELDLLGLGGLGVDLSSPQSRDVLDNQFTQLASLRGGIDRLSNLENQARIADADPLAVDVIGAIRSGAAGIPFTNNPGALKQGREDLTTEVVKSLPSGSRLSQDNLAPAIFNTLEAGIGGIDRQLSLYANKPDANITTPAALANTYLGSGNKENSARNRAAYIDAIKNVAGESFDLNNPTTRSNISKAIATQEFGSAGAKVMDDIRGARNILDNFNLDQLRLNEPLRSDVNQLGTLDPIPAPVDQGIIPVGEFNVTPPSVVPDEGILPVGTFDVTESNRERIDREQRAIQDRGGRPVFNLGPGQTGVDIRGPLAARLASVLPDQALETLEGRRDRQLPDQVFDLDTTSIQPFSQSAQVQELLNRGARAQEISNIQRALDRDTVAEDLDRPISFVDSDPVADSTATTDLTRGPSVSVVGSDVVPSLEVRDIVGDVTQERVADILNRPDRFKDTFKIGDAEFPNLIATLANKAGSFFDRRLFDGIVKKGLDAVVDPDTGRIIGAKDEFGNLIEGRDLDQFRDEGGDSDPIGTFLRKATEDKKEDEKDEKPPNVIGDTDPIVTPPVERPTVVKSTAPASTASFTPVGFDVGNLNDLIARITGVPAPRRMQEGGTVAAVDRFLSKVA